MTSLILMFLALFFFAPLGANVFLFSANQDLKARNEALRNPPACIVPVIAETPVPEKKTPIQGATATWYSRDGCLACRPDRIMANGETLEEDTYGAAYDCSPLGTILNVTSDGRSVLVEVTDRIGDKDCSHIDLTKRVFEDLGNLNLGTMNVFIRSL